ncbi:hypothetical protein [Mycolicibacterium conceptionense]|uniref:hypothetical protein n=1 Tax=Mycolicibacterium conceptionense TaxID=451644 RepID=UPI0007E92E35|nr:hypothetical protein [Mycolicibacterium conceptionense]OBF31710.1 hypothetical protein A5720_28170 [Mycolicibacterium conceptionense]
MSPHDLIDVPGEGQFEVIGYPEDYSHSPWPFPPDYPILYEVGVHSYSSTTTDDYGRDVAVYNPAKSDPGTPLAVYGWANPTNTEPKVAGHDRVVVEFEVYVPPFYVVNLRRVEG